MSTNLSKYNALGNKTHQQLWEQFENRIISDPKINGLFKALQQKVGKLGKK